jgi:antitoxin HicB
MAQVVAVTTDTAIADYLKQPYARVILPETDGTFRGEMVEFPGCIATGETPAAAFENLEDAAKGWLMGALEKGQPIPRPVEMNNNFSGKLVLRLPKSLHQKATWVAEREGVSLNQFIVASLAIAVGEMQSVRSMFVTVSSQSAIQPGNYGSVLGAGFGSVSPVVTHSSVVMTASINPSLSLQNISLLPPMRGLSHG